MMPITVDFFSVRIFRDCVKHSVASSVALYTIFRLTPAVEKSPSE